MNFTRRILAVSLCGVAGSTASAQLPTLAEVQRVWAEREGKVEGFRAKMTCRAYLPRGCVTASIGKELSLGVVQPPQDTELITTTELVVGKAGGRVDEVGEIWSAVAKRPVPREFHTAVGDGVSSRLIGGGGPDRPPSEMIERPAGAGPSGLATPATQPLLTALRGVSAPARGWELAAFQFKGVATVNTRRCYDLTRTYLDGGKSWQLYLDAERSYCVVRFEQSSDGYLEFEADIDYRPDAIAGWMPASWVVALPASGKVRSVYRCTLESLDLTSPVESSAVRVGPPPGSRVIDASDPTRERHALVRADGVIGQEVECSPGNLPTIKKLAAEDRTATRQRQMRAAVYAVFGASVLTICWRSLVKIRRSSQTK